MTDEVYTICPLCKGELAAPLVRGESFNCARCKVSWNAYELENLVRIADAIQGQQEKPKIDDETGPIGTKQDVARLMFQMSMVLKGERANLVVNALTNMLAQAVMGAVKDEYRASIKDDILGQLKRCLDHIDD